MSTLHPFWAAGSTHRLAPVYRSLCGQLSVQLTHPHLGIQAKALFSYDKVVHRHGTWVQHSPFCHCPLALIGVIMAADRKMETGEGERRRGQEAKGVLA